MLADRTHSNHQDYTNFGHYSPTLQPLHGGVATHKPVTDIAFQINGEDIGFDHNQMGWKRIENESPSGITFDSDIMAYEVGVATQQGDKVVVYEHVAQ
jgi:hypothetical protein